MHLADTLSIDFSNDILIVNFYIVQQMCGAAVPITCDNVLRSKEVSSLTRNIDCVWGCYCAQGYVRSNSNGKCILEDECRDNNAVEFALQSPGMFKRLSLYATQKPQQIHIHNHNEASTGSVFISGSS